MVSRVGTAHHCLPSRWAVPTLQFVRFGVSESYEVHIAKAEHVFSAAHFISFADHCERLHGHNYHVTAEIAGPLDQNHLVIDFLQVRAKLLEITTELDHYVLLPTQHSQIRVEENGGEATAILAERRWVF